MFQWLKPLAIFLKSFVKVLNFDKAFISESQNLRISESQNLRISESQNLRISESQNLSALAPL
ncbi:hypothetical protein ASE21_03975 [Flavobacterium sp. Root901]|nr:hypothetical protein ASE21_03975 [Flavobacterium sp. Root901]